MNEIDVFTPTGVPTVTYIDREDQNLESQLRTAVRTPGMIASLSGPSKSGKTVLINKVIKPESLIAISGAAIKSADMLWARALNWLESPSETTMTTTNKVVGTVGVSGSVKGNVLIASGEAGGNSGASIGHDAAISEKTVGGGIHQVIKEISKSEYVLLIDDFHYMEK